MASLCCRLALHVFLRLRSFVHDAEQATACAALCSALLCCFSAVGGHTQRGEAVARLYRACVTVPLRPGARTRLVSGMCRVAARHHVSPAPVCSQLG
jgi:hypothetical protein